MVSLILLMDSRESECGKQVERFASIRSQLCEGNKDALSFLERQEGPFTLLPFSRKKLQSLNESAGLPIDGILNLSSRFRFVHSLPGLTSDTLPFLRELLQTNGNSNSNSNRSGSLPSHFPVYSNSLQQTIHFKSSFIFFSTVSISSSEIGSTFIPNSLIR